MRKIYDILFFSASLIFTLLIIYIFAHIMWTIFSYGISFFINQPSGQVLFGDAFFALIVTTVMLVITTLLIVTPVAIASAVYLQEYAKKKPITKIIRLSIQTLASIPSIIYGLFGMLVYIRMLNFGMSILTGAATLSLMLLPLLITQIENSLSLVPKAITEASYGLGSTKFETIMKIIVPQASSGIFVATLLATSRIIGESAALLFTLGTFKRMPLSSTTGLISINEPATTLTIRAFIEFKEYGDVHSAMAIGVIVISTGVGVNLLLNLIKKLQGKNHK